MLFLTAQKVRVILLAGMVLMISPVLFVSVTPASVDSLQHLLKISPDPKERAIIIQRLGGQIVIDPNYTTGCKVVVILPV